MTTKNDVTGDLLKSKPASESYRNNYDAIFRKTIPVYDPVLQATITENGKKALEEIVRLSEEMGFYDDFKIIPMEVKDSDDPYTYTNDYKPQKN